MVLSRWGKQLFRNWSICILHITAFSRLFAKVDLPLPFEPRSQALLAVVSLLSSFHPSRFGPVLRRLKRFSLPPFAFSCLFAKVDLPLPFEPRSQALLAVVSLLSAFHPSHFGPVLRRLKRFSLPSFANCGVFAKVDLPLPFEPHSQALLAVVSLLSAFHPSRFGPVLRRLKRFSLPPFANCGVFAKVCILCWVAEHYNTFCKWQHRPQRLHTSFVCKYRANIASKPPCGSDSAKYCHYFSIRQQSSVSTQYQL